MVFNVLLVFLFDRREHMVNGGEEDSDSDISVGNESVPVANNIPTSMPQVKLRPGPKSFKLQQVQKLQRLVILLLLYVLHKIRAILIDDKFAEDCRSIFEITVYFEKLDFYIESRYFCYYVIQMLEFILKRGFYLYLHSVTCHRKTAQLNFFENFRRNVGFRILG